MEYKQAILVRTDLKMGKGKIAAQVAHASVDATLKAPKAIVKKWRDAGMGKIVCKVSGKSELYKYKTMAELGSSWILADLNWKVPLQS